MATPVQPLSTSEAILPPEEWPCIDHLATEDDTPVESFFAERQQVFLVEPLYSSWPGPDGKKRFVAASNVGVFYAVSQPPLVPDVFLSLDVEVPAEFWAKRHHSYFLWEYGKPPDVAIEIVSDTRGDETSYMLRQYARMGVPYYVLWDPRNLLQGDRLRAFVLHGQIYVPLETPWFPQIGLGLTLWEGKYEGMQAVWLRWCDQNGQVIPTGAERAEQERERAEQDRQAKDEAVRRAELLAAQLRALGIDPNA